MSLTTRYPGHIIIAEDPDNLVFGTCEIAQTYGSVESCSVKREADLTEFKKCGGKILAAVMANPRFELSLKTIYSTDITPPGLAEEVTFPLAGIVGRIKNGISIDWEKEGLRMLSFDVVSWDGFDNSGAATAHAVAYTGTTPGFTNIS